MKSWLALITLGLCCTAWAAERPEPPVQDYHYGMHLDLKRIIRSPTMDFCGIREVEMLYEDSQGQLHRLRYPVWGLACDNDN
ncbi:DUF2790 domain-containing protein [Serratia marcescens]|uniref:DUF2790 domain-containing protein n=1 Tax=Serratia marcescens TaxID=615 RepID=UPI001BD6A251|nr:DUF2790 domain-containing protein [Serratia marcescens]